jgi:hypothetical protein
MTTTTVDRSHGTKHASRTGTRAPTSLSLDDLLDLDANALYDLYVAASVPRLEDVSGDLRGRMLAVPPLSSTLPHFMRAFGRSRQFPWRGKSFTPRDSERGDGINRVFGDRWKWFRFETFVGPSRAGDFDAVQLDYDNRDNPFFIRAIKDEIREIAPGLYLGQAYIQTRGNTHLALYFALSK